MLLAHLANRVRSNPDVERVLRSIDAGESFWIDGLPVQGRSVVIAAIARSNDRPILVLTSRPDRSEVMASAAREFSDDPRRIIEWPMPAGLPYERLPRDAEQSADYVSALDALDSRPYPVVFAPVAALTHAVMSPNDLRSSIRRVRKGDGLAMTELASWASSTGYQHATVVQRVGEYARRGGIVDIFSPGARGPVRIEFFGDDVDSIRIFDPDSQRSLERLESVRLLPAIELPVWRLPEAPARFPDIQAADLRPEVREELARTLDRIGAGSIPASLEMFAPMLLERPTSLLDHLTDNAIVIWDEPDAIRFAGEQRDMHARDHYHAARSSGELPDGLVAPYLSFADSAGRTARHQSVAIGSPLYSSSTPVVFSGWRLPSPYAGRLADLIDVTVDRLRNGWAVEIATDQVDRLIEIFEEGGIYPRKVLLGAGKERPPLGSGELEITASDLDGGFELSDPRLMLLTDMEIYGFHKTVRSREAKRREAARSFAASLEPGNHVVHIDHGIAVFRGLVRMDHGGVEREYLSLEFAKGERLYVPVDQAHRVTLYSSGGVAPSLNTLGTGEWARTKRRVRRAVRDMAYELIELYAARDTARGFQYGADTTWDQELAQSFPFVETADQDRAISDVKADMVSERPMDRLVCGDVGFGKTEVAIRAAFKAVNAGRQVAVLVPTTVLALQHFTTFEQRLAAFPVRIEMLSRLRSGQQQREILRGLADGSIDIVIGTHRLVQRDVRFANLGLVVIDEEQRFGVRQKEFLKQLRTEVDVITMSATPIPRTLHLALSGIRDISVIETAPNARLPIRTFVTKYDDQLVRDVVLRELERGGQVFYVHNRVHSIGSVVDRLHRLIPEARIGIGHGQMDEEVLESVMTDFVQGAFDVLVCTTIIESGVDIPNANTIIIDDADTFGLTQLYQLRGRVGRGAHRAYAYLLVKPGKPLTAEAEARLEAIQEATDLGSGMRVALRDMEIRGAGNLLGAEQSGHIAEIGYELYLRLLAQAVEEARSGAPIAEPEPVSMDLPITALIPADYIPDVELRLSTYRSISSISDEYELGGKVRELEDRFGEIPPEVEHLFALIRLRIRSERLGIASIVEREREIVIRPVDTRSIDARKLIGRFGHALKITPNSFRIRVPELREPWDAALEVIMDAVERSLREREPVAANSND